MSSPAARSSSASFPLSLTLGAGLVLLWIGERVLETGTGRMVCSWAGVGLAVAAALWRLTRARSATGGAGQVEKALLGLHVVALAALAMYFAQSDALAKLDGAPLSAGSPKLAGALAALWPAVLAAAVFPLTLMELSFAAMAKSATVEVGRVRDAMFSGLGAAGLLVFGFCAQYVAGERDAKVDLSYFRTTKPGEATRRLVESFDEPVLVSLFFPPSNEVSEQVQAYFDELKGLSKQLQLQTLDHAVEPLKAKDLGVSGNGVVVLSRGARHESIFLGTDLEKSKGQLRGLDQDVQKQLLKVARGKKTIYLTSGHGERREESLNTVDQRATIALLHNELKAQNYELKTLSSAEGLGQEVPKDAAAVMVLGPTLAFSEPEAKALSEYGARGGKLFIAIDPENALPFKELLQPLGLSFTSAVLASDVAFARKTYTPADRTIIGTKTFSSHPSVSTNGRAGFPIFLNQSGSLEELPSHPAELSIDFAVKAEPATWNDLNNNYQPDTPPEVRKAWGVVAAVTRRKVGSAKVEDELRALVLADSDAVADEVLNVSKGNAYLVVDGLKWLFGDEQLSGTVNQETDVPITRTRQQDVAWFYATTFLAPVAVIGAGLVLRQEEEGGRAMKANAAAINGALALAGLVAAYVTWQRPKEAVTDDNVTVLDASKSSLGRVRFEDGARVMELYRTDDKAVWLSQATLAGKLSVVVNPHLRGDDGGVVVLPDGGSVDAGLADGGSIAAPTPPAPAAPRHMRGNDRAETLLARFTPFEAVRALGKLPADKQKELGLEGGERKLTVTVSGQEHRFVVSNPQPGMIGTYLRAEKDGAIYLLTGSLLSELEPSSQALVDRRLHAFRAPEFDEFAVTVEGTRRAWLQKDADIPQTMKVFARETPDKPDELVRNWHDKVWNRLIVTEVLGKGEAPKGGEPKVELRVDYLTRGSGKGFLELGKAAGELWARTENTASWVGLHTGSDDVIAEAKKFATGGK